MSRVFFYANGGATAHYGEVVTPATAETVDAETVFVAADGPKGFGGRVFEVEVSDVRALPGTGRAEGST